MTMTIEEWIERTPDCRPTTAEGKAFVIRVANRYCDGFLTEANIDAMLDEADTISRRQVKQKLGPFWLMCRDPELPYDTPASGWVSLRKAVKDAKKRRV